MFFFFRALGRNNGGEKKRPGETFVDDLLIVLFFPLQECVRDSKKRRTDRVNNGFWSSKQLTDSSSIEKWLMARKKIGTVFF